MQKFLTAILTLQLLLSWSCSKETVVIGPSSPPPFVPTKDCRVESWVNTIGEGFSYEFEYEADLLSSMRMTAPSAFWPVQNDFRYKDGQLSSITQTLDGDFTEYDSLVTEIKYDSQERPVTFTTTEYLDGSPVREGVKEVTYDFQRFILRQEKPGTGPLAVFFRDNAGNIERLETYKLNGNLISVEIAEFDDRPSPFRDFPQAFKIHFHNQIGLSWINNVKTSECETISEGEIVRKELEYTYNEAGFPTIYGNPTGTLVFQVNYQNCE